MHVLYVSIFYDTPEKVKIIYLKLYVFVEVNINKKQYSNHIVVIF